MCTEVYAYKRESTYMCMHKNMQISKYKKNLKAAYFQTIFDMHIILLLIKDKNIYVNKMNVLCFSYQMNQIFATAFFT